MTYAVTILADSTASGVRLTTVQATYPRIIHSEVMTHRVFSRNAASSRAIPVEKSIERVLANPFIPEAFTANKKGMQGGEDLADSEQREAQLVWARAKEDAVAHARSLAALGAHKHWANRLLEAHSWITTIITATEWENFFALRCHPAAAPEFQKIAGMIRDAMKHSDPCELVPGDWHLPMVDYIRFDSEGDPDENPERRLPIETQVKLSIARCARVSYLTHEGKRDVDADLALYDKLLTSGHLSPFEHAARAVSMEGVAKMREVSFTLDAAGASISSVREVYPFIGNFQMPWRQHRQDLEGQAVFRG